MYLMGQLTSMAFPTSFSSLLFLRLYPIFWPSLLLFSIHPQSTHLWPPLAFSIPSSPFPLGVCLRQVKAAGRSKPSQYVRRLAVPRGDSRRRIQIICAPPHTHKPLHSPHTTNSRPPTCPAAKKALAECQYPLLPEKICSRAFSAYFWRAICLPGMSGNPSLAG